MPSFLLLRTGGKCKFIFNPLTTLTNRFPLLGRTPMIMKTVMWLSSRWKSWSSHPRATREDKDQNLLSFRKSANINESDTSSFPQSPTQE